MTEITKISFLKNYVRIALTVSVITWMYTTIVSSYVMSTITEILGNTVVFDVFSNGFDRTVYTDLFHNNNGFLTAFMRSILILWILWVPVTVFLNGGILGAIQHKKYDLKSYFDNCRRYFLRHVAVDIIMMILMLLATLIVIIPIGFLIGDPLETFDTEKPLVWIVMCLLLGISLVWFVIWIIAFRSKMRIMDRGLSAYRAFVFELKAFRFVYFVQSLIWLICFVFIIYSLHLVQSIFIGNRSTMMGFIVVLLMAVIFFIRVYTRVVMFHILHFYLIQNDKNKA